MICVSTLIKCIALKLVVGMITKSVQSATHFESRVRHKILSEYIGESTVTLVPFTVKYDISNVSAGEYNGNALFIILMTVSTIMVLIGLAYIAVVIIERKLKQIQQEEA